MLNSPLKVSLFGAVLLALLQISGCSSKSDTDKIEEALEDLLTDNLEFENSTVQEGSPPESSESADAPQIKQASGDNLRLGAPFAFKLESDFAAPETVSKTIVYVDGATKYIVVDTRLAAGLATLIGRLSTDRDLKGEDFDLQFALQTDDGLTGNYTTLDVEVLDESPQDTESVEELALMSVEDGTLNPSGRPDGSSASDVPQITDVKGPENLEPGGEFTFTLTSDYPGAVNAAILAVPGGESYWRIPGQLTDGEMTVSSTFTAPDTAADIHLVLLWALEGENGSGLYRSWTTDVEGEADDPTDGDDPSNTTLSSNVMNSLGEVSSSLNDILVRLMASDNVPAVYESGETRIEYDTQDSSYSGQLEDAEAGGEGYASVTGEYRLDDGLYYFLAVAEFRDFANQDGSFTFSGPCRLEQSMDDSVNLYTGSYVGELQTNLGFCEIDYTIEITGDSENVHQYGILCGQSIDITNGSPS